MSPLFLPAISAAVENPEKPRISVGYTTKGIGGDADVKDITAALTTWIRELGEQEGFRPESYIYQDIGALMKDYQKGKFDLVFIHSLDYFSLTKKLGLDYYALARVRQGKTHIKYALVVSNAILSGDIRALKGKKLAIIRQNDLGMAVMNTLLLKANLPEANRFFSEVQLKGKESQAILSVFFGQADACITTEMSFKTAIELNPQVGKKLRIISISPELIETVAFFSDNTTEQYRERVMNRMARLPEYPRGRQILLLFNTDEITLLKKDKLASTQKFVEEYLTLKGRK